VVDYRGECPGEGWHVKGWLERWLWLLAAGVSERRRLRKRRWRCVNTGRTSHSRPPDEWGSAYFCWLFVVIKLWPWLNGTAGLHNVKEVSYALDGIPSSRTVQRRRMTVGRRRPPPAGRPHTPPPASQVHHAQNTARVGLSCGWLPPVHASQTEPCGIP
jgi:hypothetical protein